MLEAHFGSGFHRPHLRGTTVQDWPLNVFSEEDAAAQLSILVHAPFAGAKYHQVSPK
jgi:hypothetical protein